MPAQQQILVSIPDAAKALAVGRTTVYGLINDGELKTVKIGDRHLVVAASIGRLVERRQKEGAIADSGAEAA